MQCLRCPHTCQLFDWIHVYKQYSNKYYRIYLTKPFTIYSIELILHFHIYTCTFPTIGVPLSSLAHTSTTTLITNDDKHPFKCRAFFSHLSVLLVSLLMLMLWRYNERLLLPNSAANDWPTKRPMIYCLLPSPPLPLSLSFPFILSISLPLALSPFSP